MASLIRRHSMERLELYDLDKLEKNYQSSPPPPPLPPSRNSYYRRPSMNPSVERYQFLCNMKRTKTDPIYAATPMFTTIPKSSQEKTHRQLIGSYIRLENIKPIASETPISPAPKKIEIFKDKDEKDQNENNTDDDDDDDDDYENQFSSSSSSDEQEDDDGDKKNIVEQIFNRHKKD